MQSFDPSFASSAIAVSRPRDTAAILDRMRSLLGVGQASLLMLVGDSLRVIARSGADIGDPAALAELQADTILGGTPRIIPDTALHHFLVMPRRAHWQDALRFYAGIPIIIPGREPLLLTLCDHRPRSAVIAHRLARMAAEVTNRNLGTDLQPGTSDPVDDLLDAAYATARIGVWQCNLGNEALRWTDGVYDLFGLPRGSPITRALTLRSYTDDSRAEMEATRARAIANCSDLRLDVKIVSASGALRWMRLTGTVQGNGYEALRIFGMKQDITEEKLRADRLRHLAEVDVMTGLANRGRFQQRLADFGGRRRGEPIGALLLVDLDGFKKINDTHGHAVGDDCLKEAARRLRDACTGADLVSRIGGDEFGVILRDDLTPHQVEQIAHGIVVAMRRPFSRLGKPIALGASVGVAFAGAGSAAQLFRQADAALYAAKAAGRNTTRSHAAR